jgi:23S rRNA (cytidine1920-2'-O)/16S rRNA (cytidine1409-2'-O)-methyltransferase
MVDPTVDIQLISSAPFVSRGGEKLAGALDSFGIDPAGRICLDVGASTGGFTDCLLQRGATRVYALDVGRGQLAESLRADPRVISLERTHARRLDPADPEAIILPERVSLAVIDVSFISVTASWPASYTSWFRRHDRQPGQATVRVRAARGAQRRRSRDPAVQARAVDRVQQAAVALGLEVRGECPSAARRASRQPRVLPASRGACVTAGSGSSGHCRDDASRLRGQPDQRVGRRPA